MFRILRLDNTLRHSDGYILLTGWLRPQWQVLHAVGATVQNTGTLHERQVFLSFLNTPLQLVKSS